MRETRLFDVSDMYTTADAWGWTWEREIKNKMPRKWSQEWEVELAIKIMHKVFSFIAKVLELVSLSGIAPWTLWFCLVNRLLLWSCGFCGLWDAEISSITIFSLHHICYCFRLACYDMIGF